MDGGVVESSMKREFTRKRVGWWFRSRIRAPTLLCRFAEMATVCDTVEGSPNRFHSSIRAQQNPKGMTNDGA